MCKKKEYYFDYVSYDDNLERKLSDEIEPISEECANKLIEFFELQNERIEIINTL